MMEASLKHMRITWYGVVPTENFIKLKFPDL